MTRTLAWAVDRYLEDMQLLGRAPGASQAYSMRALARMPLGARPVPELQEHDYIDFCKQRRRAGVSPSTITHDLSDVRVVLKYARSAWRECKDFAAALGELEAAQPLLNKLGLIGKSAPRKRRPTDDEIARLLAYGEAPALRGKQRMIPFSPVVAFALVSTRRLGEIARMKHGDIDWDKKDARGNPAPTYWVRDMKHPTKKRGNDKEFALLPEMAEIIRRQPRVSDSPEERVFKFNAKSFSAAYTIAKKRLGIQNLRFHDNRREAITRWLEKLPPHKVRQISGHETTIILERVYSAPRPEDLLKELRP